jgi:uncharacterized RDD family membrane protein YckC
MVNRSMAPRSGQAREGRSEALTNAALETVVCSVCGSANAGEERRCQRCGRRLDAGPPRTGPIPYLVVRSAPAAAPPAVTAPVQGSLFTEADLPPVSLRTVDVRRHRQCPSIPGQGRTRKQRPPKRLAAEQQTLEFAVTIAPERTMESQAEAARGCDTPVAPLASRAQAALIDLGIASTAALLIVIALHYGPLEGRMPLLTLGYFGILTTAIFVAYKTFWCLFDTESFGMRIRRLRLVDFDGKPVHKNHRLVRLLAGHLSVVVGIGLLWAVFDEENLSWHDHISRTFLTADPDID